MKNTYYSIYDKELGGYIYKQEKGLKITNLAINAEYFFSDFSCGRYRKKLNLSPIRYKVKKWNWIN